MRLGGSLRTGGWRPLGLHAPLSRKACWRRPFRSSAGLWKRGGEFWGVAHPSALTAIRLANALFEQGELSEAEGISRETFELQKGAFGAEHEDTLDSADCLARALLEQGKLAEAAPILRRSFGTRGRMFGAAHPDTLNTANYHANAFF